MPEGARPVKLDLGFRPVHHAAGNVRRRLDAIVEELCGWANLMKE